MLSLERVLLILVHQFKLVGFDKNHQKGQFWRVEPGHAFGQQFKHSKEVNSRINNIECLRGNIY